MTYGRMILRIVALVWMLCSTTAVNAPFTFTEVTTPAVRFKSLVTSMISHPDNSDLLVVSAEYAVWTLDPKTKQKILIAGSGWGYREGKGRNALFGDCAGLTYFNSSTTIVADEDNGCMRLVNLETHLTERYAGQCRSRGYEDGNRLLAKFQYVWGITKIGDDFYICEFGGRRIRRISNDEVSTVVYMRNLYVGITSVGNRLIYTITHGLGEFNLDTNTSRVLTGTGRTGSTDGSLSSARFFTPYDVVALSDEILLVADTSNSALRIVDQKNQTVSTIKLPGGSMSLLPYNGDVLMGGNDGKIVKLPIDQLSVTGSANLSCQSDLSKTISPSAYSVLFVPEVIQSNDVECRNCPPVQNLSVGVHQFSYTYWNKLGYVEKICHQTVTVNAVTGKLKCPENMNIALSQGSSRINATLPRADVKGTRFQCLNCPRTQMLSKGAHVMSHVYHDKLTRVNVTCSYNVSVKPQICPTITVVPQCPRSMKLILPHNINELNFSLPQPQVDQSWLNCINCPDSVRMFTEGVHNVAFTYLDMIYNKTTSCNYTITVIKQTPPKCMNETRRLFVQTGRNNTDLIQIGDSGVSIRFDVGVYEVKIRDDCFITYIVKEVSRIERRVEIQAEYPAKCSTLKSVSLGVIDSQLLVHTRYLKKYCSECQIDGSPNPDVTCINDTLISTWKTGISADNQKQSENIKKKLLSGLIEFQNKYSVMDITIVTTLPRIVSAVKDSSGLNVRAVVKTTCVDKGFIYNKRYDVCELAAN